MLVHLLPLLIEQHRKLNCRMSANRTISEHLPYALRSP